MLVLNVYCNAPFVAGPVFAFVALCCLLMPSIVSELNGTFVSLLFLLFTFSVIELVFAA